MLVNLTPPLPHDTDAKVHELLQDVLLHVHTFVRIVLDQSIHSVVPAGAKVGRRTSSRW